MDPFTSHRSLVALLSLAGTAAFGMPADSVHTWERWQQSFTAAHTYENEYADVTLEVRFTDPEEATSTARGFWDGGDAWRVRFAFPGPGTWTYETVCSNPDDPGLHGQTGSVTVTPYAGDNPLYSSGFPGIEGGHHFEHRDGTPFFYLADTAWEPWIYLAFSDWTEYVDDRAGRGFTVIQTANGFDGWWGRWPDGGCTGSATEGIPPWLGPLGEAEKLNPAHFQVIDDFAEYANSKGIVLALFGIMNAGDHDLIDPARRRRFAETLLARLQGNAVILSPPVDDAWSKVEMMRDTGEHLRATDDRHHPQLLTYHIGSWAHGCDSRDPGDYSCSLHDEPWVDFSGYQSGHMKPERDRQIYWAVRRAYEMPLHFRALTPARPAVNVEPLYEMPPSWFPPDSDIDDNAYRCRQIGWYTYLSGGAGHTYGVRGIWDFGRFLEPLCGAPAVDWQDALDNRYSLEAEYTGRFLKALEWELLVPRHDLVRDQSVSAKSRKVLAQASDGSYLVAYLPRGESEITIDVRGLADNGTTSWYDPRAGSYELGPFFTNDDPDAVFPSPDPSEDWVLLVLANGLGPAGTNLDGATGAPPILEGAPNPSADRTGLDFQLAAGGRARLRVYDASGRLVTTLVDRELEGGIRHAITWDGTDREGKRTAPGVYAVTLEAGGQTSTAKLIRLP